MAYCIYLRKSRKDIEAEAAGAGETLARHRAVLLDLAHQRGYEIGQVYTELGSGDTIQSRPVMQQLLSDVRNDLWQGVLVHDIARLARGDPRDQGEVAMTFRYSSPPTLIITPDRIYDPENEADEEYFEFGLFFARREYKTITRRLMAGRVSSTREGKYVGSVEPYGYERYKLKGEKGWSLRVVPHEAEFVRKMFDWISHGRDIVVDGEVVHQDMGANRVADALNELGSRTRNGNLWTPSSVRVVLHNPLYVGQVQFYKREKRVQLIDGQRVTTRPLSQKRLIVDGRHDPIVTREAWDAAQAALNGRNLSSVKRSTQMKNPLSGLVTCSECGMAMVRTPMYGHLAGIDYLKCSTPRCATSSCPLSDVEGMILETLSGWIEIAEQAAAQSSPGAARRDDSQPLKEAALARIADLQKRRERLMYLVETGVYDAPTYTERAALLQKELDAATAALDAIPEHVPTMQERLAEILPQLRHVVQAYDAAESAEDKNRLLKSVVDHVVYHKLHQCKRNEDPAKFVELDVFPVV